MRQVRVQRRRASQPAETPQPVIPTEPLADTTQAEALLDVIDETLHTP